MLQKIKNLAKEIGTLSISLSLAFVIFIGLSIANGWTEPTQVPPLGNLGAPINTGSLGQVKAGGLMLNTVGATMGLIVDKGSVGIGTVTNSVGSDGTALKLDVEGRMGATEYCDSDGNNCVKMQDIASLVGGGDSTDWLVNKNHTKEACIAIGGQVDPNGPHCRIPKNVGINDNNGLNNTMMSNALKCPNGWSKYNNWHSTKVASCYVFDNKYPTNCSSYGIACTTGKHDYRDDSLIETCSYTQYYNTYGVSGCQNKAMTCSASIGDIGCY